MRGRTLCKVCLVLSALMLVVSGCGGNGPGAPGGQGSENTGVEVDLTVITPTYLGAATTSVDAFQEICDPGPPPVIEPFTSHQAVLTFEARLLNPNTTVQPPVLFVTQCKVQFARANDSIGAPPIESFIEPVTVSITPPTGTGITTVQTTVVFVDLVRKNEYVTDVTSGQFTTRILNNYTATYTCEGQNALGETFVTGTQSVRFEIGDFDNCATGTQ